MDDFGEVAATKIKQSQKHLSDEEISQIVELYNTGKSTYALAEQFNCHRSTISTALKGSGVTPDKSRIRKSLDADAIIKLYQDYHTTEEIGQLYGVHRNVIIGLLKANGVPIRSRWDYPPK